MAASLLALAKSIYYYYWNKMIVEGKKWAVFHLISKHSLNINFLFIFFWIINDFEKFGIKISAK